MITILIDHNIRGRSQLLWATLVTEGWANLLEIQFITFDQVGLANNASDRVVWRFAQANKMLLLTNNRNNKGKHSLQQTLQEENVLASLPVLTIGNIERLVEKEYRESCADRLIEIIMDLDIYLGAGRIFIP